MKKTIIAIDIDDVIANTTDVLRAIVNERTGSQLTLDHYHNVGGDYWQYYERVWQTHGLSDKFEFKDFEAEMVVDQSMVPLLPGAEFALHELMKRHHVVFITARNKTWEKATRVWFNDRFANDDIELYFCESLRDKNAKTKGQICKELGAEWLIDDNVEHCKSAIQEGLQGILFGSYGWQPEVPKGAVRCEDWQSVLEHFNYA